MELPNFQDLLDSKTLTEKERKQDFDKLLAWSGLESSVKLIGNSYIQHYMMKYIAKTKYENKPSLYEILNNDALKLDLYNRTVTKDKNLVVNMSQAYSRRSPICFLKPSSAKYIYNHFKPTKILDFTAGWGGRMVGAYACNIDYIGIDTNIELREPYTEMMNELSSLSTGKATMIWEDCLTVDFSKLEYDFVFTSPPYFNKEIYEHMSPFESKRSFYCNFLIPMLNKSLKHIQNNGWVCININPEYYNELIEFGFRKAEKIVTFQQSTRKTKENEIKLENVYCWKPEDGCSSCSKCQQLEEELRKIKQTLKSLLN